MSERIYTPSEELYHALCAVPGPWQLAREGMYEGYLHDLYPAAKRQRIYAQVIVAHARQWLLTNRQDAGSRVSLRDDALRWVAQTTNNAGDWSEAAGMTGSPLTYNPLRWLIAERLIHEHELAQTVAVTVAELLTACYYLYPSESLADTPLEYAVMLPFGEEVWKEVRA